MSDETQNQFDPSTFKISAPLNGKLGIVTEAAFIRHKYPGSAEEVTVKRTVVVSPDLDKPRILLVSAGGIQPSATPNGEATLVGPFYRGTLAKNTNTADFIGKGVKPSGFPMNDLGARGLDALVGAKFIWTAIEKKVNGELKAYEIPKEFLGFATAEELAAVKTAKESAAPASEGGVPAGVTIPAQTGGGSDIEQYKDDVRAAVVSAVSGAGGEIPRAKLSLLASPLLVEKVPAGVRGKVLFLLTQDSFLATVPGVEFDAKTLKVSAQAGEAQAPATEAA